MQWLHDPAVNEQPRRTDRPAEVIYFDKGRAIVKGERYFVCKRNGSQEIVVQSDFSPDRAQYSVDVLNEQEEQNARYPVYYWRPRNPGEFL